jgi:hypothetical protein
VDEPGQPHDARQVVNLVATAESGDCVLGWLECIKRPVPRPEVEMPITCRALDPKGDRRTGVGDRRAIEISEPPAYFLDVLYRATLEIGAVDRDVNPATVIVGGNEFLPAFGKRAVKLPCAFIFFALRRCDSVFAVIDDLKGECLRDRID